MLEHTTTDLGTAIVRAVIELPHKLGIAVVAKGIETEEQVWELRSLGCEQGQRYHFSRPLTADAWMVLPAPETQAATPGIIALGQLPV